MVQESSKAPDPGGGAHLSDEGVKELRARCAELLRRAVLTLAALPDRDKRYLASLERSSLPEPLGDDKLAYGYHAPRTRRFKPTPADISRCLDVLSWLTWLESQPGGDRDVKIIVAKAFGAPMWRIGQQFDRSEQTIRRWYDGAVMLAALKFRREIEEMR